MPHYITIGRHTPLRVGSWITASGPHWATPDYLAKLEVQRMLCLHPESKMVDAAGGSWFVWPSAGGGYWVASMNGVDDPILLHERFYRGKWQMVWHGRSKDGARLWLRPLKKAVLAAYSKPEAQL